MATTQPRVQAPGVVARGDVFLVRTLISHPMETGLRVDEAGQPIPRNIINTFTCRYNGVVAFTAELHESVAANPFLSFYLRADDSGTLEFIWREDGGAIYSLQKSLTVEG